jgi:hypothetical protein
METAASLKQERDKPMSMTAQNDEPTLFQVHPSVSALVPGLLLHPGFERGQVSRRLLHWRSFLSFEEIDAGVSSSFRRLWTLENGNSSHARAS